MNVNLNDETVALPDGHVGANANPKTLVAKIVATLLPALVFYPMMMTIKTQLMRNLLSPHLGDSWGIAAEVVLMGFVMLNVVLQTPRLAGLIVDSAIAWRAARPQTRAARAGR